MARLYLVTDKTEIDRRRALLRAESGVGPAVPVVPVVEVWQDLYTPDVFWLGDDEARRAAYGTRAVRAPAGLFWLGEESKAALERVGPPLAVILALPDQAVSVYYGPNLTDIDSLPSEESLKARVLSAHGIAVLWMTYDRFGRRSDLPSAAPTDPTFHLRRPRGLVAHVWRLFRTRQEAIEYVTQHLGDDPEAIGWVQTLPSDTFEALLERFANRPGPPQSG